MIIKTGWWKYDLRKGNKSGKTVALIMGAVGKGKSLKCLKPDAPVHVLYWMTISTQFMQI